jgi:hypothetical protein
VPSRDREQLQWKYADWAIGVVGHADTALKKFGAERVKFEMHLSILRATAAIDDLKSEIKWFGWGKDPDPIEFVKFANPVGMGSKKKLISNPVTESQMKLNRRVEIYYGQCLVPDQWTWRDAAERGLALVKAGVSRHPADTDAHNRIRCMLDKILKVTDADDAYLDYQAYRHLFFPPGFTKEQKEEFLKKHVEHLEEKLGVRKIFGPATEVRDDDFMDGLEHIDEVITRSMRDFANASAQSGASVLVVDAWRVIQESRTVDKSIYKCYASYHW